MKKSYHSSSRRLTIAAAATLTFASAIAACSSDDDGDKVNGNNPGTGGSKSGGAGTTGKAGSGGSSSTTGGSSSSTGGTTGSGNAGNIPTQACSGVPFKGAPTSSAGGAAGASGSGGASAGAAGTSPSSAGGSGGEEACAGVSLEAEALDVDLFIMMDRSVSMGNIVTGNVTRWDAMKTSIDAFAKSPNAAKVSAGIGFFNQSGAKDDTLDCDVAKYAQPVVGIELIGTSGPKIISAMNGILPGGLTPTTPALRGAVQHAKGWAASHPNHVTAVLLVTDGFPTQCGETSPTDVAKVAQAAYLEKPSIRTFVVGVGEAGMKFNLDNYARAGGTRQAYLTESNNVSETFIKALNNITDSEISCEYEIPEPPSSSEKIDYEKVSIIYHPNVGQAEEVPKVGSLGDCAKSANGGWYYDDPANPKKIAVCPCTCANFGAGRVDVRLGCKPVIIIR